MASQSDKAGPNAITTVAEDDRLWDEKPDPKHGVTATTTAVPREDDAAATEQGGARRPDHDMAAAIWTIVCGVALPCIPVIVISGVLLYFIFHYRVVERHGWPDLHLSVNHTHESPTFTQWLHDVRHHGGPAYYVHYNPSTITTIASWTGRVIPYLSSSIMALVAFFAARRIVTKSKTGDGSDLPTPEQLTLLIDLLGGKSLEPIKDTLLHRWGYKRRLADPIPLAFTALLLLTSLSLLIPIVDTWFGIATTPAIVTQLYNGTKDHATFGRALSPDYCPDGPGSFSGFGGIEWVSCNVHYDDHDPYYIDAKLAGPDEATRVVQGYSSLSTISNTTQNGTTYYYLADKRADARLDFKATTFAITTQCKPITQQCLHEGDEAYGFLNSANGNFTCTPGFQANFTYPGTVQVPDAAESNLGNNAPASTPSIGLAFSPDAELSSRIGAVYPNLTNVIMGLLVDGAVPPDSPAIGSNLSYQYLLPRNPLHFGTWGLGFPTVDSKASSLGQGPLARDPQIYSDGDFLEWVLQCSATVYDVRYTFVNGSVHTFEANESSPEMAALISAPFAWHLGQAATALDSIANLASLQNTSVALADVFARGWSAAALALSAGVMSPQANIIEQYRNSTIAVARVPKAPLWLLLGLKAIYVIAVILLAIGAYCFTHPAETEVVKAQLSAKGLAAAHFDTPDMLQKNVVKELNDRLQATRDGVADQGPDQLGPRRAATAPGNLGSESEKKVGLVARADGAWRFAVVANGVWNGIKPIAVDIIGMEAKQGNLGAPGGVINAWMK